MYELDDIVTFKKALVKAQELENVENTGIGQVVGKLRSDKNEAISKLAKGVVDKWKKDVSMSSNKRKKDEKPVKKVKDSENGNKEKIELENRKRLKPQDEQEGKKEVETKQQEDESQSKKAKLETNGSKTEERTFDSDSVKIKSTENKMRDNGIKMLYNALVTDSDIDSEIAIQKAIEIESKEFEKNKANEKDKKNPALRENILCGDLSTDRFVNMTTQEMASEERKLADIQINSENMFRAR
ncbi:Transcription elongation factor S-II, partial [Zancudomyces culisetae]